MLRFTVYNVVTLEKQIEGSSVSLVPEKTKHTTITRSATRVGY